MAEQNGTKQWYVAQTYSGKENSVKQQLINRIGSCNVQDYIFQVVVPEETIIEEKDGVQKEKVIRTYPGYIFIEMIDNNESWWVVRNTPGVTGFLGSSGSKTRPVPISYDVMEPILIKNGIVKEKPLNYTVGDFVTFVAGNFKDQTGKVVDIDLEHKTVNVVITLMNGKGVNVECSVKDIDKID